MIRFYRIPIGICSLFPVDTYSGGVLPVGSPLSLASLAHLRPVILFCQSIAIADKVPVNEGTCLIASLIADCGGEIR